MADDAEEELDPEEVEVAEAEAKAAFIVSGSATVFTGNMRAARLAAQTAHGGSS